MARESEFFSGRVILRTPEGLVELDIRSAKVLRGREILEDARVENRDVQLEQAREQLEQAIKAEFTRTPQTSSSESLSRWSRFRQEGLERFRQESIFTLLPETPNRLISRVGYALVHSEIRTKTDLAEHSLEYLMSLRNIRKVSRGIIEAMRNVAIAELARSSQTSSH